MTLKEWIKRKVLKFLGIEKLASDPNSDRLVYISDDEQIQREKIAACKVWYLGNGDELLNYYTGQEVFGFARNPIYNRNKRNYFWGLSSDECNIKRVHSGVPRAIVDTIDNIVGMPKITAGTQDALTLENKDLNDRLQRILENADFSYKLMQQARPMTLVEGWGAWKPIFNSELSDTPLVEFYPAENVEFIVKCGVLMGVIFKSYYKGKDEDNHVLIETRSVDGEGSKIEYDLFKLDRDGTLKDADLADIPELAGLQPQVIPGFKKVLAVPCKYFYDPLNPKHGRSIYEGKLDLFDDLDQSLSQRSQTSRVSTPVEYYDVDLLERSASGEPILPSKYNRQYVAKQGAVDGEGRTAGDGILTTQPTLNFDQYNSEQTTLLNDILIGVLSPATLGIDLAKRDNADAQREKEKASIMTRNNIIERETRQLKDLANILLMLEEYMRTGQITLKEYPINVNYDEFANPSFENELQTLGAAWSAGQISTKKYAELLWGDKLSKEELEAEEKWLDENREKDNADMDAMFGDGDNVNVDKNGTEPSVLGGPAEAGLADAVEDQGAR